MKIRDLQKYIPIDVNDIEVGATETIEHYFFSQHNVEDFRNRSIDFSIKNKIRLSSTANNWYEIAKRFIRFQCPCGQTMEIANGGGNMDNYTVRFLCQCGNKGSLTFPRDGIQISFDD